MYCEKMISNFERFGTEVKRKLDVCEVERGKRTIFISSPTVTLLQAIAPRFRDFLCL
jgi:hypothetical protein